MFDFESLTKKRDRIKETLILGNFSSKVLKDENESFADFKERARQAYFNDSLFHHAVDYQLSKIMFILQSE